jgi:trk system potassium uptake protein TrkH
VQIRGSETILGVTGLVTVDTGAHFSRFGQTIILVLFQVGGLGLMTFAAFFAIALGKGMGIKDRHAMKGVLDLHVVGTVVRVIVGILFITFLVEGVSTLILYGRMGADLPPHERFFHSAFHAVSAFCNAGFSLNDTSLMGYVGDPVVNITVMLEIVIGGLGFAVLLDLFGFRLFGARIFAWLGLIPRSEGEGRRRLSVQTRIVLITSLTLILVGAGLLYLFEASNPETMGGLEPGARAQAALFQSITARTAGFNTLPIGDLTSGSKFLLIVLMIIGASPGSTGGGVKTVTSVVLLLAVISFYRNRQRVEVYRRTLPQETVRKAIVIVVTAFAVVSTATLVLAAVEGERFDFLSILFEVGSAFGTVGLSTGVTGSLSAASKLTLCLVMLVGRIGPLSLVIALSQARAPRGYEYPEEHVMIG